MRASWKLLHCQSIISFIMVVRTRGAQALGHTVSSFLSIEIIIDVGIALPTPSNFFSVFFLLPCIWSVISA